MAKGKKTGGRDFKPGESVPHPGPVGPRWGTVIREFMDAPASAEFTELAREMGITGPKEKATMRMAMIARAVKTYMKGVEKTVVVGEQTKIVHERAGDPRILVALMDREDGKGTTIKVNGDVRSVIILPDNGTSRD